MSFKNYNEVPVRESIRKLNSDSWVVGDRIFILRVKNRSAFPHVWSDGKGAYFAVSDYNDQIKNSLHEEPLPADGPIQKVYDTGDANAVWSIGDAFLKIHTLHSNNHTREHTVLSYLHDPTKPTLSFPIPQAIFHAEFGGRYYLITSRVSGQTLETVWPSLTESSRQFCVNRVVDICKELLCYGGKGTAICGVDNKDLNENWMASPGQEDRSPRAQFGYCSEIGMDCSDLVLSHNDMGPYNVMVDFTRIDQPLVGIIDWEMAGYVPREWVRTKFRICHAMDFDFPGHDSERMSQRTEWRRRVQLRLGEEGFQDVGEAYMARLRQT